MVVYNLYIFNRNGQCLFYREWLRRQQTKMTQEEVREKDFFFSCKKIFVILLLGI